MSACIGRRATAPASRCRWSWTRCCVASRRAQAPDPHGCDALSRRPDPKLIAHHAARAFEAIRTNIEWGPIFSRDPITMLPGSISPPAAGAAI
ncbi:MAG: hypothetical protein O2822_07270 [Chloroflexi bacterium]|nr:hypothetical protein [Chloroflexota bacterium]